MGLDILIFSVLIGVIFFGITGLIGGIVIGLILIGLLSK